MADSPSPMTKVRVPEWRPRAGRAQGWAASAVGEPRRPRAMDPVVGRGLAPLWVPIAIVLAFLTASWLGLWLDASPYGRPRPWPTRRSPSPYGPGAPAPARAPEGSTGPDAGLRHGPARTLDDSLAIGSNDPGTRALWDLHRKRAEAECRICASRCPTPTCPGGTVSAPRAAGLLAVVASAFVAGPEVGTRLAAAFDWRNPQAALPTFRVDGWIDPPSIRALRR